MCCQQPLQNIERELGMAEILRSVVEPLRGMLPEKCEWAYWFAEFGVGA
jgi:hypothetical protein